MIIQQHGKNLTVRFYGSQSSNSHGDVVKGAFSVMHNQHEPGKLPPKHVVDPARPNVLTHLHLHLQLVQPTTSKLSECQDLPNMHHVHQAGARTALRVGSSASPTEMDMFIFLTISMGHSHRSARSLRNDGYEHSYSIVGSRELHIYSGIRSANSAELAQSRLVYSAAGI